MLKEEEEYKKYRNNNKIMGSNSSHFSDDEWCYVPFIGLQGTFDFRAVGLPSEVPQQVREKYSNFPNDLWVNVVLKTLKPGFQEYSGGVSYGILGMIFFNIVFALAATAALYTLIPSEPLNVWLSIVWMIIWFILRSLQRIRGEGELREKIQDLTRMGPLYKFQLYDPNSDGKLGGNNNALFLMIGAKNSLEHDRWHEKEEINEHYMTDFPTTYDDDDIETNKKKKKSKSSSSSSSSSPSRHGHPDKTGVDYYDEDYGGLGDFHGKKEKRKVPIVKKTDGKTSKVYADDRHAPHGEHTHTSHTSRSNQQILHLPSPKVLK